MFLRRQRISSHQRARPTWHPSAVLTIVPLSNDTRTKEGLDVTRVVRQIAPPLSSLSSCARDDGKRTPNLGSCLHGLIER